MKFIPLNSAFPEIRYVIIPGMNDKIIQFFPQPTQEHDLLGLYLNHNLRQFHNNNQEPFVYSNFVTSSGW